MRRLLLSLALAAASSAAWGQEGMGLGLDIQELGLGPRAKRLGTARPAIALAVASAFGPEVWAKVGVSTSGAVVDLSHMARAGCYKLELVELTLLAAESGQKLKVVMEKRKKGASLSVIASGFGVPDDRLYEEALAIEEIVDREYLPRFPERKARKRKD